MKIETILALALGCGTTTGCNSVMNVALSVPTRVEWQHVQSTGGMTLGFPFKTNGTWRVAVECEATGKFITRQPDVVTSFPVYYSGARVWLHDGAILMYLESKANEDGLQKGRLGVIDLPQGLVNGNYDFYYVDKDKTRHFIQSISLLEPVRIVGAGDTVLPEYRSKK
jgi:hypothetical protein